MDTFPTDPALFKTSSTTILLRELSSAISALPPDLFSTETIRQIGRYRVYVADALPVLTKDPEYGSKESFAFIAYNDKLKRLRQGINDNTLAMGATPFLKPGAKLPLNNVEASQLARNVIDNLKMILKVRQRWP